jgi:hypothetical protein
MMFELVEHPWSNISIQDFVFILDFHNKTSVSITRLQLTCKAHMWNANHQLSIYELNYVAFGHKPMLYQVKILMG